MKERFSKLLTIKSIVTLILTIGFFYLSVTGAIKASEYIMIFTTVIAFYFGTQAEKKSDNETKGG